MLRKLSIIVCVLSTTIFLIMPSSDPQNFRKKVYKEMIVDDFAVFREKGEDPPKRHTFYWETDYEAMNFNRWVKVFISGLAVASLAGIFVFKEDSKSDSQPK